MQPDAAENLCPSCPEPVSSVSSSVSPQMTFDPVTRVPTSPSNPVTFSSRWRKTSANTLVAGWAGASIRFTFTGSYLSLKFGAQTQRKNGSNAGKTRMLDVSVYPPCAPRHTSADPLQTRTHTFDAEPSSSFIVPLADTGIEKCIIEITRLIDWESVVEIESFVVDAGAVIESVDEEDPVSQTILVIGDSISCGYAGDQPLPRGCLDAFPFQAQRILERDSKCKFDIELVAYEGAFLVEQTDEERSMSFCMANKFFHISPSPWDSQSWEGTCAPVAVALALGTNDETRNVSFDRFTVAVKQFSHKLVEKFPSVREIWLVTPFDDFGGAQGFEFLSEFRQSLLSSSSEHLTQLAPAGVKVCICDVQDGMTKEMTVDTLHPTLKGHEILGRNFAEFVRASSIWATKV